ncbi:E3 ubiquitin-protein ligase Zswim2 [Vanrija pseudolonga]|uniref:E3 ubiquitin-protein ligase Zswim2 n=1 Tax=Vanrija pseudolonga TaxID=143232 RepID=A0AAF0YCZ8_9TREE|nr:E3 ubiquitin-protein ligase Zswim2 [Vanrija pseudolonga]
MALGSSAPPAKKRKAAASTDEAESSSAAAARAEQPEKRALRERAKCPVAIAQRSQRVMSQRMFMVDREDTGSAENLASVFKVLGSTGNVYTVEISHLPSCDCPDFAKGNSPCKHIIFIFLKVLKVPLGSTVWYQRALLTSELRAVMDAVPAAADVAVAPRVRAAFLKATGSTRVEEEAPAEPEDKSADDEGKRLSSIGEDCPVCFEEMSEAEHAANGLVFDLSDGGCGKPLHAQCFAMWSQTARAKSAPATCVWCRSAWKATPKPNADAEVGYSGGYLNLAELAGVSRERDTSSYYQGINWRKRNRDYD